MVWYVGCLPDVVDWRTFTVQKGKFSNKEQCITFEKLKIKIKSKKQEKSLVDKTYLTFFDVLIVEICSFI